MAHVRCDWQGVYPAAVTPFTKDGALDEQATRDLIEVFLADGVHGFIAVGSTGEWFSLSDEERVRVFEIYKEQVKGRVPIVAGTSAIGTRETVALTQAAKDLGLDGCMVLPPPYAMPTKEEVVGHYAEVAKVGLPIMIYNNPPRTGINVDAAMASELAKLPEVVAFKDSTKDLYQTSEAFYAVQDRLACFAGLEPYGLATFSRGAVGIVSTMSNVCAPDLVEYCEHLLAGRYDQIARSQRTIDECYHLLAAAGAANYVFVKEAMAVLGRPGGYPRMPYRPVSDAVREKIRAGLAKIDLKGQQAARAAAE